MNVEYLDLNPASIDTPVNKYSRFRFLYAGGEASIFARSGYALLAERGVLEVNGRDWRFTSESGDVWDIVRTRGCSCSQSVVPKAMLA